MLMVFNLPMKLHVQGCLIETLQKAVIFRRPSPPHTQHKDGIAKNFTVDEKCFGLLLESVCVETHQKEKVSEDASDVVETRRCTVEVDSETEYESDDDSDYQSDKSVDYLSPSEDELIELRNRMKANRKAKTKAKDKLDEEMNEPNE
ncbi:hypothetical protein Tco_1405447 [Tanacetum coccineum]